MFPIARTGLALAALALATTAAPAQQTPAKKAAPAKAQAPAKGAAPAKAQARPATPAGGVNDGFVVATVNGKPITRGQVLPYLSPYTFGPDQEAEVYDSAVNALVSVELLRQFLDAEKVAVAPAQVDAEVAKMSEEVKGQGGDLTKLLAETGADIDELKNRLGLTLRWQNYFTKRAEADGDSELRTYYDENKDLFHQNQLRASHILVKVEPDAPEAAKEQAQQKLAAIKAEIEAGKLSFAAAADKHSEDDGNVETKTGGDLGYFTRRGQIDEKFAAAAFALKPGAVSEPIATDYGYHLIQVTDRKEGEAIDFVKERAEILKQYGFDLREKQLADLRKSAKIELKPMPPGFFPRQATAAPAATPRP